MEKRRRVFRWIPMLSLMLMLSFMLLLAAGCGSAPTPPKDQSELADGKTPVEKNEPPAAPVEKVKQVVCPLTGEKVPEGSTDHRPLAIMIENAPEARPQSGLDKADVVYEILAEGAITRFMAIYLHNEVDQVGPVRSARPYYIERMLEYDAIYAHCGGSAAALQMIKRDGIASLDEFWVGRSAFWRSSDRKAPHNLYADTKKLREVAEKKGYEKTVDLPKFSFLAPGQSNPGGGPADSLVIDYYRGYSKAGWQYDPVEKLYLRSEAGSPHRDAVTGKQLTGRNILVQYTNTKVIDSVGRLEIDMVGRGKALLFTGGQVYEGTWSKESMRAQTFFYDAGGRPLKLNPGQTWIEVVPQNAKVEIGGR